MSLPSAAHSTPSIDSYHPEHRGNSMGSSRLGPGDDLPPRREQPRMPSPLVGLASSRSGEPGFGTYAVSNEHSSQTDAAEPPTSSLPSALRSIAASHPYSTAFLLGSSLTLAFLSSALLTKRLFSRLVSRGRGRATPLAMQHVERVMSENRRWMEEARALTEEMRALVRMEQSTRSRPSGHNGDHRYSVVDHPAATSPVPASPSVEADRRELQVSKGVKADLVEASIPSPAAVSDSARAITTPTPATRLPSEIPSPSPSTHTASPPTPPTKRQTTAPPPSPQNLPPQSPHTRPAADPARPSILAFYGLRSGIGKLGPMPIVDTANPNYITFAEQHGKAGRKE